MLTVRDKNGARVGPREGVLWGVIAADGTVTRGSGGFTSGVSGSDYTITFDTPYGTAPVAVATVESAHVAGSVYVAQIASASTTAVVVTLQVLTTVPTNGGVTLPFHFVVYPV